MFHIRNDKNYPSERGMSIFKHAIFMVSKGKLKLNFEGKWIRYY